MRNSNVSPVSHNFIAVVTETDLKLQLMLNLLWQQLKQSKYALEVSSIDNTLKWEQLQKQGGFLLKYDK